MKTCNKCKVPKELDKFSKCSQSPDGLNYRCRECDAKAYQARVPVFAPALVGVKICSTCRVEKGRTEFSRDARNSDGLQNCCKACNKVSFSRRLEASPGYWREVGEDGLTAQQRWNAKNPGRWRAVGEDGLTNQQRWNAKNPEYARASQLKAKYGITPEDFDRMLNEQGGACALCKDTNKKWCVDHCHITGKVRSILCYCCNIAIGNLGDSPKLATAAAEYLTKHQPVPLSYCPSAI